MASATNADVEGETASTALLAQGTDGDGESQSKNSLVEPSKNADGSIKYHRRFSTAITLTDTPLIALQKAEPGDSNEKSLDTEDDQETATQKGRRRTDPDTDHFAPPKNQPRRYSQAVVVQGASLSSEGKKTEVIVLEEPVFMELKPQKGCTNLLASADDNAANENDENNDEDEEFDLVADLQDTLQQIIILRQVAAEKRFTQAIVLDLPLIQTGGAQQCDSPDSESAAAGPKRGKSQVLVLEDMGLLDEATSDTDKKTESQSGRSSGRSSQAMLIDTGTLQKLVQKSGSNILLSKKDSTASVSGGVGELRQPLRAYVISAPTTTVAEILSESNKESGEMCLDMMVKAVAERFPNSVFTEYTANAAAAAASQPAA